MIGLTLVVPLWVLGHTAGDWRAALKAWRWYVVFMLVLSSPAALIALWQAIF